MLLADYLDERQAFEALIRATCQRRILLFRGESGSGKTTLLNHCRQFADGRIPTVNIDLKGGAVTVAEFFSRTGNRLDWSSLSGFASQLAELQDTPKVEVNKNWLTGIGNKIYITLHAGSTTEREQRRAALTDALFEDIGSLADPVLFILDTFEKANTELQEWLSGPFLARVERAEQVRVLIAGQTVPDENNIEWGHCCTVRPLRGVPDPEHWLPVIEALGRHINSDEPRGWLEGICDAFQGRPNAIMQMIQALPSREPLR